MADHRKHITTAAALASVALATGTLISSAARATPASGLSTEQLAKGVYGPINAKAESGAWELELKTRGTSDVYVVRNTFSTGGQSGWHTHPGPSLITVTSGQITVYEGDGLCQPTVYGPEDGAIDLGSGHVHNIKNEGASDAVTVVVQIIPTGATRRIDASEPNNCASVSRLHQRLHRRQRT
jgi:quercetin dioxygenase-like cupin family protein